MRAAVLGAGLGVGSLVACTPIDRDEVPDLKAAAPASNERAPEPPPPTAPDPEPAPVEDGCFAAPVVTPLEFSPNGSVTADVDADAVLDYVTFRDELVDGEFQVHIDTWLGDRAGHFRRASSVPYAKGGLGIAFDDLDCDGHLDMITGDHRTASFTEWRGDGAGAFIEMYTRKIGSSPHTPLLGDLDGDGRRDLMIPRYRMIEVYLSAGAGAYRPMPWIGVAKSKDIATPEGLSLADLDGDGDLDVIAPLSDDNALVVLLGRGDGRFRPHLRLQDPCSSPQASAVADFDGDTHLDVAVGCGEKVILVYRGDGTGALALSERIEPPGYLVDLVAAEVTGDRHVDLVASGYAPGTEDLLRSFDLEERGYVVVYARAGAGLAAWTRTGVGMHYTHGLRIDDVNEDGLRDVMFAGGGGTPGSHLGVLFGRPCPARQQGAP